MTRDTSQVFSDFVHISDARAALRNHWGFSRARELKASSLNVYYYLQTLEVSKFDSPIL